MNPACRTPVPDHHLTAYWLDDLDDARIAALEDHVFDCGHCSDRLMRWAGLIDGLREAARAAPPPVISRRELAILRGSVRIFEVFAGGFDRVSAPVPEDVDICVFHIPVDLTGVQTVDLLLSRPDETPMLVLPAVALDPPSGEVIVACTRHVAAARGELRFVLRGHRSGGEVTLADCRLVNGPL